MKGFRYLWVILHQKYGFKFMIPQNISQDSLENFLGCLRLYGARNHKPTVDQFISSFKAQPVNNCASVKSPGSNCMEDKAEGVLTSLRSLFHDEQKQNEVIMYLLCSETTKPVSLPWNIMFDFCWPFEMERNNKKLTLYVNHASLWEKWLCGRCKHTI